jgi:hypothetical protein
MGFSPGFFEAHAKAHIKVQLFSVTLKRCSPLLKQRAPTKLASLFKFSNTWAVFINESRMKFVSANKLDRKSGRR